MTGKDLDQDAIAAQWEASLDSEDPAAAAEEAAANELSESMALQWAAMRWARDRGCTRYDLWGIPDEVGADPAAYADPDSWGEGGLWGVYRFKQGFGGQVVRYTGAWDMPLSKVEYALYRLAVRARQRVRNG